MKVIILHILRLPVSYFLIMIIKNGDFYNYSSWAEMRLSLNYVFGDSNF